MTCQGSQAMSGFDWASLVLSPHLYLLELLSNTHNVYTFGTQVMFVCAYKYPSTINAIITLNGGGLLNLSFSAQCLV